VRIAALCIGTGLTHTKAPAGLIRACEAHGLNLIEVPRATPFVAISRRTAQLLQQDEANAARETLRIQRRLTSAAAKPDATAAVIQTLAHVVGGAACVLSTDGHAILGPLGERGDELLTPDVVKEIRRLRHQGLRAASAISTKAATTVVHPLGLGGRPSSYLALMTPGRVSDRQRSAITTAVALLGLIGEQERTSVDTRRQLRSRAIELLSTGDSRTAQLILHIEQQTPVIPAHIRILRATGARDDVEDALATLEQQRLLVADIADELCLVAQHGRASSLASSLADTGLLVGVGEAVALNAAATSYATAGHALAQATTSSRVVQWERIVGEGPLSLIDPKRAEAFATSFLAGLDDEQLETLRSFLRHHGSRQRWRRSWACIAIRCATASRRSKRHYPARSTTPRYALVLGSLFCRCQSLPSKAAPGRTCILRPSLRCREPVPTIGSYVDCWGRWPGCRSSGDRRELAVAAV